MALDGLKTCNCSHCQRRGSILAFVPEEAFRLLSGEHEQTEYQFNKKKIHHMFCPTCGIGSYSYGTGPDGSKMVAVNVRCLEGVDAATLTTTLFNGRDL